MCKQQTIFTIGHSTRSIEDFIDLLKQHGITELVDIRTIPKSRHNPQFGQAEMRKSLAEAGIEYSYLAELGGLRPAIKHSTNTAWRNASFRNYADYMQTGDFEAGLQTLIQIATNATTAIMCAEAVPWRCHRSLVADALLGQQIPVCEIIGLKSVRPHVLTNFAQLIAGGKVTYPGEATEIK